MIVTVGSVVERPSDHDRLVVARPMLPRTLSFDHAVIDGAPPARFTETLRTLTKTAAALAPRAPELRPGEHPACQT
ncbi:MAG TPA: 2-oxo acid dehydrogenase subunit E2 [Mycobacterium sp.]|nr:2-oxo acid dehydrogenase subunit E2 [Mycobacterium sp.]